MYLIGICVFLAMLLSVASFSAPLITYYDLPSILLIVTLSFPVLMASGLLPDFGKGFKLMGQKNNTYSAIELKRMLVANKLAMKLFLLSGAIGSIMGGIAILTSLNGMSNIGPGLAMIVLTSLYAIILTIVLLPIQAKILAVLTTLE